LEIKLTGSGREAKFNMAGTGWRKEIRKGEGAEGEEETKYEEQKRAEKYERA
jgi:hypothetical protein